jgi:hypothetical protein
MIKNVYWSSHKIPLFLSDFNKIWIVLTVIRKILKYQITWKSICFPCGQTDGQTDTATPIVAFRYFPNAHKTSLNLIVNSHKASCISAKRLIFILLRIMRCLFSHLTTPNNNIWDTMQSLLKLNGCNFQRSQWILSKLPAPCKCTCILVANFKFLYRLPSTVVTTQPSTLVGR